MPPSIRAISSTRSAFVSRRTLVWVRPVRLGLVDDEVGVGQRRDLRQVRDADHLAVPRDVGDGPPDHLGDGAADAGVDLVEDVRADGPLLREHALERQQRARQLAAARDLAERPRLFSAGWAR